VKTRPPFLPTDWTYVDQIGFDGALTVPGALDVGSVAGAFELLLPEQYSNSPINAALAFSGRMGYVATTGRAPFSPFAGGLRFETLEFIPRASAVTVRFTPTYSRTDDTDPVGQFTNEYRLTAVLSGYKKVKALR
jgi:hypothetical protein